MVFPTTKEIKKSFVDITEAFNLWAALRALNMNVESAQIWENYIHDTDFRYLLKKSIEESKKDIKAIEEMMEKFSIKGPDSHPPYVRTFTVSEVMRDQYIASQFFVSKQEIVEGSVRVTNTCTTNDTLRRFFANLTKKYIQELDNAMKYLKLKGWIEMPPLYPHTPQDTKDKIDCIEASLLWEHLGFRYDNIKFTDYYYAMANDGEFKLLLKEGINAMLRKQVKFIEKETEHFGIPAPVRPSNVMPPITDIHALVDDDYMFRSVFAGLQGAAMMHVRAFKQCMTNDRIRILFRKLLLEEMDGIDDLIKYGKLKGWLDPVPKFSQEK